MGRKFVEVVKGTIFLFIALVANFVSARSHNLYVECVQGEYKCKAFFKNSKKFDVNVGLNGATYDKKEGDFSTPIGAFTLSNLFVRNDKIALHSKIKAVSIHKNYGWCDDINSLFYNKLIDLNVDTKYCKSYENLWRDDDLYDLIIPINYNNDPIKLGNGSAIFIHIKRDQKHKTAGCIAFDKVDLLHVIKRLKRDSKIFISIL